MMQQRKGATRNTYAKRKRASTPKTKYTHIAKRFRSRMQSTDATLQI
jgi:hypothetical protein